MNTHQHHNPHAYNQLKEVEKLLKEFYSHGSTNDRKQEIEKQLEIFKNRPDSWQICLEVLPIIQNQPVWFFCCTTIEIIITKSWHLLTAESKHQLRESIWTLCLTSNDSTNLEKQKICQLIALIGKREFPGQDVEFMERILSVVQTKFLLGLMLLLETNTEIMSTKADVTSEMKRTFTSAVQDYLPVLMPIIQHYITIIASRLRGNNFAIPSADEANLGYVFADESRLTAATIELLLCVQNIFSWANLDTVLTEDLLQQLFAMSEWNEDYSDVRISALATVADLFYRQQAMPLQIEIAGGIFRLIQQPQMTSANEQYQDRMTELLRLFTDQQWRKWVNTPEFPVNEFLAHLFTFTFAADCSGLSLTERLGIWKPVIQNAKKSCTAEIKEQLLKVIATTIKRIQFHYDPDLDLLDNYHIDNDLETEYQQFQNHCIDIIALVAEMEPVEVFEMVLIEFNKPDGPMHVFNYIITVLPLKHDIYNQQPVDRKMLAFLNDTNQCHTIHCMLRDLSTQCQIIARISPIVQSSATAIDEAIQTITRSLMAAIKVAASKQLSAPEYYTLNMYDDFNLTIAQILTTVKFMVMLTPQINGNVAEMNDFVDVLARLLRLAAEKRPNGSIDGCEPTIIVMATAQLLFAITSELKPCYIIENLNIQSLASIGSTSLQSSVQMCIYKIMCNIFILPWTGVNAQEQKFEERKTLLKNYVNQIAGDLVNFDTLALSSPDHTQILNVVQTVLLVIAEILDHYQEGTSHVKTMLAEATKTVIDRSRQVYHQLGPSNTEISEAVLTFFLSVVRTLQLQLGTSAMREYLQLFLHGTTASYAANGVTGLNSLKTLLQILLVVVEQPGTATLTLIPDMLKFALGPVMELVNSNRNNHLSEHTDVTLATYLLFDGILLHRWQYFYTSQVKRGFSPGASDVPSSDEGSPMHPDHLHGILMAYGQALVCGNDPQLARTVLGSLEKVEERCRLYSKEFFKENLLSDFLTALLNAITSPEGAILFDLLINVLFKMGRSSQVHLHRALTIFGLPESQIVHDLCSASDLPTFTHYMQQIIQDITVCRILS